MPTDGQPKSNYFQSVLALTLTAMCAVCGTGFDAPVMRGRGRPKLFCSDRCRLEQSNAQKTAWAKRQRAGGAE